MKMLATLLIIGFIGVSSANTIQVPCLFSQTPRGYTCRLPDVNLADQDFVIVGGEHLAGQNDGHVINFVSINNNFRQFPNVSRFINLRHVQVTGGIIERVTRDDFSSHRLLQTINLGNNQISFFDEDAFANLPDLQDVNLRFNRIRNLIPSVFNAAPSIEILDLSYNSIERLSSGTLFSANNALATLLLSGNRVDFINQTVFNNLNSLNLFDLSSNICYSGTFFGINVPSTRQQMLQRLQPCFSDSPINLPCQFETITMNDVSGYGCTLTDIKLYDINRQVSVGGFHISPNTNDDVRFLRIQLSHTPFIIKELFTTFPNLEGFEIMFSDLSIITTDSFENAQNLKYISIRNNPIRRIEANVFQYATNLEELYFWWNTELESISEYAFTGLGNLHELHLINSNIPSIPPRVFRPLTSLVLLELEQNRLDYIDSRWFSTNRQLRQLMVNSNNINALHPSILNLPQLSALFLQGNRCVNNIFFFTDSVSRENVRNSLRNCFDNYPARKRRFVLDVEGDITLYNNENNNEVFL